MNIAIVFGGGVGSRFSKDGTPKQFVELYGKPIIIYTLENFSKNSLIDEIVIPCVEGWTDKLKRLVERFDIRQRCHIIPGGATSHESRLNALQYVHENLEGAEVVVLHDAVRPFVTQEEISATIEGAKEYGSSATYVPLSETPAQTLDYNCVSEVSPRSNFILLKAPQAFRFDLAYKAHVTGKDLPEDVLVDASTLMSHLGYDVHLVRSTYENIKITNAKDYFIFKALVDAIRYESVFGLR